jgi:hypothetical protein
MDPVFFDIQLEGCRQELPHMLIVVFIGQRILVMAYRVKNFFFGLVCTLKYVLPCGLFSKVWYS